MASTYSGWIFAFICSCYFAWVSMLTFFCPSLLYGANFTLPGVRAIDRVVASHARH